MTELSTQNQALPDPHPVARVSLALLRTVIKLTFFPAVGLGIAGFVVTPLMIFAVGFGAVALVSFLAVFVIVFFFYARYSLLVMVALVAILNGLILCVISNNPLLIVGGIFGIGLYLSLLCIRISGFYPDIEDPPHGECVFLLQAVGRARFGVPALIGMSFWFAGSCRLLSETLSPKLVWLGVAGLVVLAGVVMGAVVRGNVERTRG